MGVFYTLSRFASIHLSTKITNVEKEVAGSKLDTKKSSRAIDQNHS